MVNPVVNFSSGIAGIFDIYPNEVNVQCRYFRDFWDYMNINNEWFLLMGIVSSFSEGIAIRVDGGHTEVREYTNFTLICETTTDIGRIKWFQNGRRMAVSLRRKPNVCSLIRSSRKRGEYATKCKGKQLLLVLEEVTSLDSGRWSCEDPNVVMKSNEVEVKVVPDVTGKFV